MDEQDLDQIGVRLDRVVARYLGPPEADAKRGADLFEERERLETATLLVKIARDVGDSLASCAGNWNGPGGVTEQCADRILALLKPEKEPSDG